MAILGDGNWSRFAGGVVTPGDGGARAAGWLLVGRAVRGDFAGDSGSRILVRPLRFPLVDLPREGGTQGGGQQLQGMQQDVVRRRSTPPSPPANLP